MTQDVLKICLVISSNRFSLKNKSLQLTDDAQTNRSSMYAAHEMRWPLKVGAVEGSDK